MSAPLVLMPPAVVDAQRDPQLCWYCGRLAINRCETHKTSNCGRRHCVALHRLDLGKCVMWPWPPAPVRYDWWDCAVALIGVIVLVTFFGIALAHGGAR